VYGKIGRSPGNAVAALDAAPGAGTIAGAIGGYALGAAASAVSALLDFVATVFLSCGFVLAFVLPMFPFTRFFFAVLSWLGSIVEAVIAMPLVALAHLNPEGEGLPGQAKQGYLFVFSIFLRPILSVFGLVAGLLMFLIAVNLPHTCWHER
jgi:conjugal transfer/type IV secretion protein DotA/TraY